MFPESAATCPGEPQRGTLETGILERSRHHSKPSLASGIHVTLHGETYISHPRHRPHGPGQTPGSMCLSTVHRRDSGETLRNYPAATPRPPKTGAVGRAPRAGSCHHLHARTIIEVLVKKGDVVKAGDAVLVTEAMKMETEVQHDRRLCIGSACRQG